VDSASPDRREALLASVTEYVLEHGVASLSLRPLAKATNSSPRILLYYFGSKEDLVTAVIERLRDRQRASFASVPRNRQSYGESVRAAWKMMSAPEHSAHFRLFFELYGLALREPERYQTFLRNAVGDWLDHLEAPALRNGHSKEAARALATVLLAGYRGLLLDRAVEIWIAALDAIPDPCENVDG
jgi:AcrR family transcriptional regulator